MFSVYQTTQNNNILFIKKFESRNATTLPNSIVSYNQTHQYENSHEAQVLSLSKEKKILKTRP